VTPPPSTGNATAADPSREGAPGSPTSRPLVAVFGGSFNPPHLAHVLAVSVVLSTHALDKVLVVPTYRHPFAKSLAPYDDRVKMSELAMGWLPRGEVSRVEEALGGESRTLRTLEHLRATEPTWDLRLLMGADLLAESHKWFGFDAICALAPPLVLGRVGVDVPGAPPPILPAISSTDVRARIAAGAWDELASLVPRDVLAWIRSRGLYA
jgi:nicotinate-nucleotide adenylyltransferase